LIKRICNSVPFLTLITLYFSCAPAYKRFVPLYEAQPLREIPDYSNLDYWAAHPYKHDPSDSIPAPIRESTMSDSSVDVFFLHPTTFTSFSDTAWNAELNNAKLNAKTDYTTILYQASAFNECRVFAPRYRQANLRAYYTKDTVSSREAFELAYEDIRSAFEYYLAHFNQGRPIVIASHSQGSTHARRLLKEFFEDKPLQSKLVAAYIVGMVVPKNYFQTLKPCNDSLQTGCFVGWRTFRKGYEPEFIKKEKGNSFVTNPLTWQMKEVYAPRSINEGAVLLKFNEVTKAAADAQIHDGVIWIHKPHFPGGFFYRAKNYHVADINLYWMNVRMNLRRRIAMYWKR
jgi:Protein of unknown function (DUF3089)